ncbi:MAG: hypothetical protein ACOYXY_08020 [Thermodesulfobacteriota bacterium]
MSKRNDDEARTYGVPARNLRRARKILRDGIPELSDAVFDGKLALYPAVLLTRLSHEDQRKTLLGGKKAIKEQVRLLKSKKRNSVEPWQPPKVVMPVIGKRKLEALRTQVVETEQAVTDEALPANVTHGYQSTVTHNLLPTPDGWTLCHDRRGIYKAVKRIGGKLRSVYIGKDPSLSREKIRVWIDRQKGVQP